MHLTSTGLLHALPGSPNRLSELLSPPTRFGAVKTDSTNFHRTTTKIALVKTDYPKFYTALVKTDIPNFSMLVTSFAVVKTDSQNFSDTLQAPIHNSTNIYMSNYNRLSDTLRASRTPCQ